jgi:hypothetical protein
MGSVSLRSLRSNACKAWITLDSSFFGPFVCCSFSRLGLSNDVMNSVHSISSCLFLCYYASPHIANPFPPPVSVSLFWCRISLSCIPSPASKTSFPYPFPSLRPVCSRSMLKNDYEFSLNSTPARKYSLISLKNPPSSVVDSEAIKGRQSFTRSHPSMVATWALGSPGW